MPGTAGNTAQGAAGGALTGAAIGSVVPGVGTAIGAIGGGLIGGALGYFGGGGRDPGMTPEQQAMYDQYLRQVKGRTVNSDFRDDQRQLTDQLEADASGRGPSLATEQLNRGADMIGKQQQTIANAARGSSAGLSRFQAQNNSAAAFAQANQDAAAARIAEQQAARAQLGQVIHGARGQDIESQLRLMGLNDDAIARYMSTASGKAGQASTGEQLLAGGTMAAGMAFGKGAAPGAAAAPAAAAKAAPMQYGNNTMNPFADDPRFAPGAIGNATINPFQTGNPYAPQRSVR